MHCAIFIGGIFKWPTVLPHLQDPAYIDISEYTVADDKIKNLCQYMWYGHLAEVVSAILFWVLSKRKLNQHAIIISILSNIVFYLTPILYCCFYLNKYHFLISRFDTPYAGWIFLEVQIFVCWIVSSFLFLFFAYTCKYRSHWQTIGIKAVRNIWGEKDIDDFLHYLRHEYTVFCLCVSLNLFDYSQIYFVWASTHGNVNHKTMDTVVMVLNQVSRIMSLILLRM